MNVIDIASIGSTHKGQEYIIKDERKKPRKALSRLSVFKSVPVVFSRSSSPVQPVQERTIIVHPVHQKSVIVQQPEKVFDIEPMAPVQENSGVSLISVKAIKTNVDLFQNRKAEYSQESVNRIIDAVKNGTFDIRVFDAILVWLSEQDKTFYVLSGHSRLKAFQELSQPRKEYKNPDGSIIDFTVIPARIFEGTKEQAQKIALESNVLSTKETDLERANYYRRLRMQGKSRQEIKDLATRNEGNNAAKIISLSYLEPGSKASDALENLENTDVTNKNILLTIATWTGEAMKQFPGLTTKHENEIFSFLLEGGYGNKPGQFKNRIDFLNRINHLVEKNTYFGKFDAEKLLNIKNVSTVSPFEAKYNAELAKAKAELDEALKNRVVKERQLTARIEQLKREGKELSQDEIQAALKHYQDDVLYHQKKYMEIAQSHDKYLNAERQQTALFGIGSIKKNNNVIF